MNQSKRNVLHLTTHLNIGGITSYIQLITREMQKMPYRFFVGSSGGTHEQTLVDDGVQSLRLSIRTKSELSPKVYSAIKPLLKFIKQERIDLIHAHTRVTQVLSWWIQRFSGLPYVSTCHGFYKPRLGRKLLPAWGNRVIAISKPVEGSLINDFGVSPKRVTTIYNAIDIDRLLTLYRQKNPEAIRRQLQIADDERVVSIVARVVQDKGHEFFLRACKQLVEETDFKVKFLIVGEGPYLPIVKDMVKKLSLESHVIFLGNLTDITYALAITDIFVLPAVWREGFGLSIIEAMAVCIPVVVTNIWSLNELVHDRVNGLLVEPRNTQALGQAIRELIENQSLYEMVSHRGSETVRREFSISRMAKAMDELYTDILNCR